MSYSRTVYCSYCGVKGHNRRSCEQKKEYVARNPDSYTARREAEAAERRKQRGPRTCSYCLESGHNARTCGVKAKDKRTLTQKLSRQRAVIMDKMLENGIGIGTLFDVTSRYYGEDASCWLLTEIDWKQTDSYDGFFMVLTSVATGRLSRGKRNIDPAAEYDNVKVLSPVERADIRDNFPLQWQLGELYDEETYFSKGCQRQNWHFDA